MSGGHFDYLQNRIFCEFEDIKSSKAMFLECFDSHENAHGKSVAEEIFDECIEKLLRNARVLQMIDYLISGDYAPDAFFRVYFQTQGGKYDLKKEIKDGKSNASIPSKFNPGL